MDKPIKVKGNKDPKITAGRAMSVALHNWKAPENTGTVDRKAVAVKPNGPNSPEVEARLAPWGKQNKFPEYVIEYYTDCPTHKPLIDAKARYTAGQGLEDINDFSLKDFVYKRGGTGGGSERAFLRGWSLDYAQFSLVACQVCYNAEGNKSWIKRQKPKTIRLAIGKDTDTMYDNLDNNDKPDVIIGVWISENWKRSVKHTKDAKFIPIYDPEKGGTGQPLQMYIYIGPTCGGSFYPDPYYQPLMTNLEIERDLQMLKSGKLKNGALVSSVIEIQGDEPAEPDKDQFMKDFQKELVGPPNVGKFMVVWTGGSGEGQMVNVHTVSDKNEFKAFQWIATENREMIITGHQCPSPVLAGVSGGANSLGSNGGELETAQLIYQNGPVRDAQMDLTDAIEELFDLEEVEFILYDIFKGKKEDSTDNGGAAE